MDHLPLPVTLRQLQYLVAVAERLSFRQAALHCEVAQPSLSTAVAQVEKALGVAVFERTTHQVRLTAAGRVVVERARELLQQAQRLVTEAHGLADPFSTTLRIGVITTVAPYLLPELAPLLRQYHPGLSVLWSEGQRSQLVDALQQQELDAVLVALEGLPVALPHVVVGRDPLLLAVPPGHPLAHGSAEVKARKLEGEAVVHLESRHCLGELARGWASRAGAVETPQRAPSLTTLVQLAAGGAGITLLPRLCLAQENRGRALVLRELAPPMPARTLALAWTRGSAQAVVLAAVGELLGKGYQRLHGGKRGSTRL